MGLLLEQPTPYLQLVTGDKPQRTMEVVPDGVSDVGQFAEKNQAKLEELRQRRERLTMFAVAVGLGGLAGFVAFSPAMIPFLPPLALLAGELQGTSQKFLLMSDLVAAFESEDIDIEVGLQPEGLRGVDFFLKFPEKEYLLIKIRSLSFSKITYNEEIQALRFKKKRGGLKTWEPDPLNELAEQERWIRKERLDLIGTSARDRRKPIAKVLVLWDDTVLSDHPEHLYATMNNQKYLTIRNAGTVSIVERNQVISFIRDYLTSRRSRKSS